MTTQLIVSDTPQLLLLMVFATLIEAEPFVKALKMTKIEHISFPIYRQKDTTLIISGIGKVNAAIATIYGSIHFPSRWILNLGCAGALNTQYKKGDIFQVAKAIEPDRLHLRTGAPYSHTPALLSDFLCAILATQDKPVFDPEERLSLSRIADLADMEGAAVIQAAGRCTTPALLFKFVSDTADDTDGDGTIPFVREYSKHFCSFIVEKVLSALGKNITQ